jgi:two-component system, cell cycle response regulator
MTDKRVLIVDDEESIRAVLVDLMNFFGYEADEAAGGLHAMKLITERHFDLVITDINMPDLNGLELIKEVKNIKPDIDLIAITGFDFDYRYTDVIAVGASDFIVKPFENNELQAKINRVFRERELMKELERLSIKDCLTELYNRRFFEQQLRTEMRRAVRQKYAIFLLLMDIDNFKAFNDTHGHPGGDHLLRELAGIINQSIRRDVDIAFRYGGDEFGVIAPQVNREQATMIAQRIVERFREIDCTNLTSISIGIAEMLQKNGQEYEEPEDFVKHADIALLQSKQNGGGAYKIYNPNESSCEVGRIRNSSFLSQD